MNIRNKISKLIINLGERIGGIESSRKYNNKKGSHPFKYLSAILISIMFVASIVSIVLANSPATITDNFTDTSKIASSANITVSGGVVSLSTTSTWTCGDNIVDQRDNKIYTTVLIGTQCWMAQNMNIGTKTAGANTQGTDCPSAVAIEKYCYSDNEANCTTYGGLYQWNQMMCGSTTEGIQGICPTDWHIPTDAEQYTLENYLKDNGQTCDASRSSAYDCATAGTKLKSGGTSNFNGLLAGYRSTDGSFSYLSSYTLLWSSTQSGTSAWYRNLHSGNTTVTRNLDGKAYGFSVRCLKN